MIIKSITLLALLATGFISQAATILTASKDTYIDSNSGTGNFGGGTTMVSNDTGARDRMAFFSFDLSTFTGTATGVKLDLRDNIGNAGTKTYDIYGLIDAEDGWTEGTVTWNTATFRSGNTIDLTKVYGGVKLGSFNTAQNASFTAFDVTSGNYLNFLNADGNNILTFVIIDPSTDTNGSGWATREEGTLPAATLTIIPEPSTALLSGLGILFLLYRRR